MSFYRTMRIVLRRSRRSISKRAWSPGVDVPFFSCPRNPYALRAFACAKAPAFAKASADALRAVADWSVGKSVDESGDRLWATKNENRA